MLNGWSLYDPEGIPLTDLLTLLITRRATLRNVPYKIRIESLIERSELAEMERTLLNRYESAVAIPPSLYDSALLFAVAKNTVEVQRRRPEAFRAIGSQMVDAVAMLLERRLKSGSVWQEGPGE